MSHHLFHPSTNHILRFGVGLTAVSMHKDVVWTYSQFAPWMATLCAAQPLEVVVDHKAVAENMGEDEGVTRVSSIIC